jgi:hypothetical protein
MKDQNHTTYRFWAGKKIKKYLEASKLKMAAQFKMVAKI